MTTATLNPAEVLAGLETKVRHRGPEAERKGHTGLLTGNVDNRGRVEVIEGNTGSGTVERRWETIGPNHSQIRRATSDELPPAVASSKGGGGEAPPASPPSPIIDVDFNNG